MHRSPSSYQQAASGQVTETLGQVAGAESSLAPTQSAFHVLKLLETLGSSVLMHVQGKWPGLLTTMTWQGAVAASNQLLINCTIS